MNNLEDIVIPLITFQIQMKIYHWQTTDYARHIASDALVTDIAARIDQFVETVQGGRNIRVVLKSGLIELGNVTDSSAVSMLGIFKDWLEKALPTLLMKDETDLMNQREEMLSIVNKTLYLFTLK